MRDDFNMVNLFISCYNETDISRQNELKTCLMNNIKSGCFDAIYVIAEDDGKDFEYLKAMDKFIHERVNFLPCNVRPTFRTFFECINNILHRMGGSDLNTVNVIANSDIYFEEIQQLPKYDEFWALTRYEVKRNGPITFLNRADSQDVFISRGFIKIPKYCDFFALPGSDNRICAELLNVGYKVLNPSLTIKSFHLHDGPKSYDVNSGRVGRPYHLVPPIELK